MRKSTRASSMAASPASARMAPITSVRLRSDRAGHGRADVDHRRAGRSPMRVASPCDLTAGCLRHGILTRCWSATSPARVSGCRLRCCRPDLHAGFPRRAWLMERTSPAAGNNHPTSYRPACSRPRTATSISPPRADGSGSAAPRRSARSELVTNPNTPPLRHAPKP